MAAVTDEAQKKGAHAGNLIKAIAGLVGGGAARDDERDVFFMKNGHCKRTPKKRL